MRKHSHNPLDLGVKTLVTLVKPQSSLLNGCSSSTVAARRCRLSRLTADRVQFRWCAWSTIAAISGARWPVRWIMVDRLVGFIFGEHWNILLNDNCNDIWHTINIQRLQDTGFTRGLNHCWIWTKIVRIHDAEYTIKACSQNYHLSVIKPASWFILFVYLDTAPIIHIIIHAYILISGLDIINDIRPIMTASHSFIIWIHPECVFFCEGECPKSVYLSQVQSFLWFVSAGRNCQPDETGAMPVVINLTRACPMWE